MVCGMVCGMKYEAIVDERVYLHIDVGKEGGGREGGKTGARGREAR